jgi:hypothetical protein
MMTSSTGFGSDRGDDRRQQRPPTGGRRCGRAYGGVRERHGTSGYGRIGIF